MVRKIPPPGPFNLTASAGCTGIPGKQYVLLNWTASENVDPVNRPSTYDYYQVLRSENGGPFNPVTAQHLTTLSYRDEGIPSNKNYAYQVIAYNPNGFRFADPNPRDVPLQDCMAPPPVCS
ncbi:fibronectin type III domain-containing protein [Candidatus Daviesbacteria bacterium]|nr:fibronectin type III domain-containing protein [Candidatus Daviesbacteria bacterium]